MINIYLRWPTTKAHCRMAVGVKSGVATTAAVPVRTPVQIQVLFHTVTSSDNVLNVFLFFHIPCNQQCFFKGQAGILKKKIVLSLI